MMSPNIPKGSKLAWVGMEGKLYSSVLQHFTTVPQPSVFVALGSSPTVPNSKAGPADTEYGLLRCWAATPSVHHYCLYRLRVVGVADQ